MRLIGMLVSDYYSFTRSSISELDNMCNIDVQTVKSVINCARSVLDPTGVFRVVTKFSRRQLC